MAKTALDRLTHFVNYWGRDAVAVVRYRGADEANFSSLYATDIREAVRLARLVPGLVEALETLTEAAAAEADLSKSISGNLGARLTDARAAIAKAVTRG